MTSILPLTESDRDDWLALWAAYLEFYESEIPSEQTALTFARIVDERHPIQGAIARDAAGRAVGIVHWFTHPTTWSDGPYVYLEDLYVVPDVRGGGVGRRLIGTVTDWARDAGASKVYWLTQSHNATARVLYDKVAADTGFVHYEVDLA
ncbi:GNAT family N-acetyltransferase [Planococcus sp. APC 4015]|nr:GNAT family N-acetyltransferase [Planococcus sp. APC 4015]